MSSEIPPASNYILAKARDVTENKLVESVKQKTRVYLANTQHVEEDEFDIEERAIKIAHKVFQSEYESSLAEMIANPKDRKLLVALYREKVICRLVDEIIAVFKKNLASQSQGQ